MRAVIWPGDPLTRAADDGQLQTPLISLFALGAQPNGCPPRRIDSAAPALYKGFGIRRVDPTHRWRGGRVAEGGGLLNRYTVKSRIVGSNPIPSATPTQSPRRGVSSA